MASPDEADAESIQHKRGKKAYMLETMQCLMFARDNLPGDVYNEFVKTMTEIWKQCADPDGEIRSICAGSCIERAMKLLQGWAPVKHAFLNFIQGRSPFDGDPDGNICTQIQSPLDFLGRAKTCPEISGDDYATILETLLDFNRKKTMTPREVFHIVKGCMRNSPELLEEFKNNYLPPHLKAQLADEKSCRNLKSGRVGKGSLCFNAHAKGSFNDIQIKVTNKRKGSEEPLLAEEYGEDKVEPLPDWITSRLEENLPPEVNPEAENFKRCTPSYYLLPHNCITLQSSYRTKLGRSILNDTLVSPPSVESLHKTQSDYEKKVIICEDQMFESDMLLQRFRATADFIANLQNSVGSGLRISEHITPLHRRCIQKLYDDELEIDDLLESQNTSAALSILLSRLNQVVENLSEARLCLQKILPPVIAENYYRSLDHHGHSFKHFDSNRMGHKALLAEAKEIYKSRLNAGDEYANPDIHKDISRIISSMRSSEEKLMMTWAKIVHPFLSANCLRSYLEETVAPSEACEHCGINKHVLNSISVALASSKLPLSPKEGDITTMSGHPRTDTSVPSSCAHGNEPKKNNEPMKLSKQTTILSGVKGGTCCSLVVLRRLYQILYSRLQSARDLCSSDLYTEFKEQLRRLLDRSIDNCKFEDFCLKFLGPNSFELFTLDILINRVIKQLFVISSSGLLVQLLEELLRRPILPKPLSPHQNLSTGLHDREEQDGKLPLHFERRKKRKLEDGALSYS